MLFIIRMDNSEINYVQQFRIEDEYSEELQRNIDYRSYSDNEEHEESEESEYIKCKKVKFVEQNPLLIIEDL